MISLSRVAQVGKFLFPAKADMIDQAMHMAQQFSPSKDGVAQLMAQCGKRNEDLQNMVKKLDSPMAKTILSKVPGLEGALRGAASEMQGASPAPSAPPMAPVSGGSSLDNLAARLAAMK